MRLLSDYKSCVQRPVALPNAEEGFRSFLMSLRNFERMWEDGTADSLSLTSPPTLASRRLIISKGGGVKSTNSAVPLRVDPSLFVTGSLDASLAKPCHLQLPPPPPPTAHASSRNISNYKWHRNNYVINRTKHKVYLDKKNV